MDDLLLHNSTEAQVSQFLHSPSHALLLVGPDGIGKTALAEALLSQLLAIEPGKLPAHPYYKLVAAEKDSISIESIRDLQIFLRLKTLGTARLRRAVIIEHADKLTIEAQNAYLKLLEEPPADTIMVLTVANPRTLLPTILSRVQTITVHAPGGAALKTYFKDHAVDERTLTQAFFLSGGLPGLMAALLAGDETHPLVNGVSQAKLILQNTLFERLSMVEGLSKQKEQARYTLEALQHIAQTGLNQAAAQADQAKIKQWHHILKITADSQQALAQSANAKLVLSDLMLRI